MKNLNSNMKERAKFEEILQSNEFSPNSDAFEQDALEGWGSNGSSMDLLNKTDKRFLKKANYYWAYGLSVVTILILWFVLFPEEEVKQTANKATKNSIQIEKTDVLTPSKIEQMTPILAKNTIQAKTLQANFEAKQTQAVNPSKTIENQTGEFTHIETKEISIFPEKKVENLKLQTSKATEIYIHELLIIDYRKYRSKPVIKTESAIITGTAANLENRSSNQVETQEWKQVDIPYIDYITKTMGIFSKGNYKKALTRFEEVLKTYPDDLNANFYGGLCYFNLGENEKALDLFEKCSIHKFNNFTQEANWYTAKTYIAMKNYDKARAILNQIVAEDEFYKKDAKKELEVISVK